MDSLEANTHTEYPKPADQLENIVDISFYAELSVAETIEDFKRITQELVSKLGFSDFLFRVITREDTGIMTTFSPEIYQNFVTGYNAYNSLLLQHIKNDNSPVFLSQITEFARLSPIKTTIFQLSHYFFEALQRHDFNDCYCMSRKSQVDARKVIFIVADKNILRDEFQQKVLLRQPILHLLGEAIAVIGSSRFPEYFFGPHENAITITPKPLRLLNVIAKQNITLKDAAKQLCISLDTANKHIAAAKSALGAKTLTSTIYKAVKEGIIEIDE